MVRSKITDFELARYPAVRVASIVRFGPWKEDHLRPEFRELVRWAQRHRIRTGRWIFLHSRSNQHRWEACLEIRGRASAEGRIRIKTLPATWIARVIFDPDTISSRLVYHGLHDWTKWRRIYHEIRSVSAVREVFAADPWKDARAWHHCDVQFLVRR